MRALILQMIGFVFAISATPAFAKSSAPSYPFERQPGACECFPNDASSKQYIAEGYSFPFGEWKTFTCGFTCLDMNGQAYELTGTQTDHYRISDQGDKFVCKGFVMKFMETPMDPKRLGFFTIDRVRPFDARSSNIPEIAEFAQQACTR